MVYKRVQESSEAIVLGQKKLLQKDVLVLIYSKKWGKLTLSAKGVRTIKSKRMSAMQTGNIIIVHTERKNDRWYLVSASLISHLMTIKKKEQKSKHLLFILYILLYLLPEAEPDVKIYTLVKQTIVQIGKSDNSQIVGFIKSILQHLGYGSFETYSECIDQVEQLVGKKIPKYII